MYRGANSRDADNGSREMEYPQICNGSRGYRHPSQWTTNQASRRSVRSRHSIRQSEERKMVSCSSELESEVEVEI